MYLGFSSDGPRPEPDHRLPDARGAAQAQRDQRRAARRHPRRPHVRDARLAQARARWRRSGISPSQVRDALAANNYLSALGKHQGLDGVGEPGRQHRPQDARGVPAARGQGRERRRGPARATSPTSCSAPRTTTRTCASTARPRRSWASGCCPPPTRSTSSAACARRCPRSRRSFRSGMKVGHPVRLDRVHRERDPRGAEDADRDAARSSSSSSSCSSARCAAVIIPVVAIPISLIGAVFLMHDRRVHDQPADAARHRALGGARGRRRDRHGGEHRAAPARREEAVRGGDPRGARAGRADHRHDHHAGGGLHAGRHPGRPHRLAVPRVRVHARRRRDRLRHRGAHAVADDGLEAAARRRHRARLRGLDQPALRPRARRATRARSSGTLQYRPVVLDAVGDRDAADRAVLHVLAEGAGAGRGPERGVRHRPGVAPNSTLDQTKLFTHRGRTTSTSRSPRPRTRSRSRSRPAASAAWSPSRGASGRRAPQQLQIEVVGRAVARSPASA